VSRELTSKYGFTIESSKNPLSSGVLFNIQDEDTQLSISFTVDIITYTNDIKLLKIINLYDERLQFKVTKLKSPLWRTLNGQRIQG
jgi:hypothetical protein